MTPKKERDTEEVKQVSDEPIPEDEAENGIDTLIVSPPSFRERIEAAHRARKTDEMPAVPPPLTAQAKK